MKKNLSISSILLFFVLMASAQSPITVSISGPSSASNNQTVTYTLNTPYGTSGGVYYWSANGGTFSNGQNSITTTGKTVSITWAANCSGQGNISGSLFYSWPPSGPPSYTGYKTVSLPKLGKTPAQLQSQINDANAYAPPAYRCSAIMGLYNDAVNNNPCNYNYSGINLHGCN